MVDSPVVRTRLSRHVPAKTRLYSRQMMPTQPRRGSDLPAAESRGVLDPACQPSRSQFGAPASVASFSSGVSFGFAKQEHLAPTSRIRAEQRERRGEDKNREGYRPPGGRRFTGGGNAVRAKGACVSAYGPWVEGLGGGLLPLLRREGEALLPHLRKRFRRPRRRPQKPPVFDDIVRAAIWRRDALKSEEAVTISPPSAPPSSRRGSTAPC